MSACSNFNNLYSVLNFLTAVFHVFYFITHPWSNYRYYFITGYRVKYVEDGFVEVIKKTYVRPLLIWNCQLQQPKTPGCICVPCIERNCVICVSTIVIKNYDWNMCIFLWDICTFLSLQWKTGDVCFKPCKDYVWLIKHIVCMISSLKWCTVFNYIYIYDE